MTRTEALELVQSRVENRNLVKHMLATEACLRVLARKLGGDEEAWGLAGLLHDVDYEETKDDFSRHGVVGAELLATEGLEPAIVNAVRRHATGEGLETDLDRALFAADPVTGLIVAAALMHPTKKLAGVDTDFIMRRWKEKRFAAGANRDQIATCSALGLKTEEFVGLCLGAMQGAAAELGL